MEKWEHPAMFPEKLVERVLKLFALRMTWCWILSTAREPQRRLPKNWKGSIWALMYLLHIVKLRKKERKKPLLRPSCHKIVIMGNKIKEIIEYYDTVVKVVG